MISYVGLLGDLSAVGRQAQKTFNTKDAVRVFIGSVHRQANRNRTKGQNIFVRAKTEKAGRKYVVTVKRVRKVA